MKKITTGKRVLISFGIAALILAVLAFAVGILIIVYGAKDLAKAVTVGSVFQIIGGVILCFSTFFLSWIGVYLTSVGFAMTATKGSTKDPSQNSQDSKK